METYLEKESRKWKRLREREKRDRQSERKRVILRGRD